MTAETWVWLLKFVHVSAIAMWVGGLLSMPYLIWQRHGLLESVGAHAVHRLHRAVRMVHVGMTSPAAVIAIGTGVPLIFLRETYDPWFMAKLLFVGVLVLAHNIASRTERRVFADDPVRADPDEGGGETGVRLSGARALALGVMIAIGSSGVLVTVLGKPDWNLRALAPELLQPGALGPILARLIPWTY
ncbi:hypothetical protein GI374_09485 [Paracoccus sp. S-4012]|uniref:CopD family protein n=1 Tax=Paracoccus sp. S-4012 TaxID=2665648 RepID=UPI0012B0933D|nr:CopD family protein [Paracoccus sp. S-4012]MRX50671.1 hypothetical protein [Paracoccus sp. S-4012]